MRLVLCLLALTACQSVQPSGDALPPTHPRPRPVEEAPVKAPEPKEEPKAEAAGEDKVDGAPKADAMSDAELLAIAMGVDPATVKPAAPPAPAPGSPAALPLPVAPEAAAPVVAPWTPGTRLDGSWGVRVVSIVADAQPPRAILGLPDGKEVVVEPGAFIDSEKLVVTAIGREAVQVAHVVPMGDRVRIEDRTLQPLYAPAPRAPAP